MFWIKPEDLLVMQCARKSPQKDTTFWGRRAAVVQHNASQIADHMQKYIRHGERADSIPEKEGWGHTRVISSMVSDTVILMIVRLYQFRVQLLYQ